MNINKAGDGLLDVSIPIPIFYITNQATKNLLFEVSESH